METKIQKRIRFERVSLGTYVQVVGGFAFKSEDFSDEGIPVVRISDIRNDSVSVIEAARISNEKAGRGQAYSIEPGDILIAMSGATTGKIGIVPDDCVQPILQNQRVGRFKIVDPNKIYKKYLKHYLVSSSYQSQIWQSMVGVAQPNISSKQLEQIEVPLPPIAQQKRIAAILDKAEELRGLRRQALGELDALTQSIFLEMFGDPEANPKHSIGTIRPFVKSSSGKSAKEVLSSKPTEIPVYGGNGINGWAVQSLYSEPVLVVGRVGQQCGKTYVTDKPAWVTDNAIAVKIMNKKMLNLTYLLYVFSMVHISETVKHLDLPFINQQMVLDFSLPIPPFSLQQEFAQRVDAIEQLKATHRESLAHLDALFASLQHRAFRGEL